MNHRYSRIIKILCNRWCETSLQFHPNDHLTDKLPKTLTLKIYSRGHVIFKRLLTTQQRHKNQAPSLQSEKKRKRRGKRKKLQALDQDST
jgi:hypothetical protein